MSRSAATLLAEALDLPLDERLKLARDILATAEPGEAPEWVAAWKAELADRWAAYESGAEPGEPFDETVAELEAELDAMHP